MLLGFNKTSGKLGEETIRLVADMYGRSLTRAREGLIDKGLLDFVAGRVGGEPPDQTGLDRRDLPHHDIDRSRSSRS